MTGLAGGLMQALLPIHVMAILSTVLLAARAKLRLRMFVAAFAAGLAAGLAALALGVGETPAADVLLAATLLNGLAVAAAVAAPRLLVGLVAFVAGCALGLDSPPDAISLREAVLGLIGTWCCGRGVAGRGTRCGGAAEESREWNRAAGRGLLDRSDGDSCPGAAVGVLNAYILVLITSTRCCKIISIINHTVWLCPVPLSRQPGPGIKADGPTPQGQAPAMTTAA